MLEPAPKKSNKNLSVAIRLMDNPEWHSVFRKIEQNYLYWDKVKYMASGDVSPETLWQAVKLRRTLQMKTIRFGKYVFRFNITERMQSLLHQFDLNFGGSLTSEGIVTPNDRKYILNSSIMEEAIASSQMEGANTTRKVAKEMLRKQSNPKNKSERMIANNYNTIRFISDIYQEDFSKDMFARIHSMIAKATLDDVENEGKFRDNNDIMVMNSINGEVAHIPPSYDEIGPMLDDLCQFANNDRDTDIFIHPIIKGIIIHFVLAYVHPFCDGNGRTARSLVYWYLLKNKYWFVEYLSISRIISRSKAKYERAFLCTESDDLDMSYFILYHLEVMKEAFYELQEYLSRKIHERETLESYLSLPDITQRQAKILKIINDNPDTTISAKLIANQFGMNAKSVRTDLRKLSEMGLIIEIPVNGREFGYKKSKDFENKMDDALNEK